GVRWLKLLAASDKVSTICRSSTGSGRCTGRRKRRQSETLPEAAAERDRGAGSKPRPGGRLSPASTGGSSCVAEVRCSWRFALTSSSPEGIVTHERRHHHARPAE